MVSEAVLFDTFLEKDGFRMSCSWKNSILVESRHHLQLQIQYKTFAFWLLRFWKQGPVFNSFHNVWPNLEESICNRFVFYPFCTAECKRKFSWFCNRDVIISVKGYHTGFDSWISAKFWFPRLYFHTQI